MECYDKEKHKDLVLGHMKQAALEKRLLDMYSRYDNYGNVLIELIINETYSILMKNEEFQEICNEAYGGITYHLAMMNYIAAADEYAKGNQSYHRWIQGTTSLHYIRSGELRIKTK